MSSAKVIFTDYPINLVLLSLSKLDLQYLVVGDLRAIPSLSTKVVTSKRELTIEGKSTESHDPQSVPRLLSKGKNIKTIFEPGVLWLLQPKFQTEAVRTTSI